MAKWGTNRQPKSAAPIYRTTVIMALDVSRSMCATDVDPNRLTVAQDAALAFIVERSGNTELGLVAFSDFAQIVVPPTRDKEVLREAIETLTTFIDSAFGRATLESLDAIGEAIPEVASSGLNLGRADWEAEGYQRDRVVPLTDGANTRGGNMPPSIQPGSGVHRNQT